VDWIDQSGMSDDRLGIGPMAGGWALQSRRERERGIARVRQDRCQEPGQRQMGLWSKVEKRERYSVRVG
jgi:hypothetical protein